MKRTLAERLDAKTDFRGPNECWEWRGYREESGHGRIFVQSPNRTRGTHVVAWELANGRPVPEGLCVLHGCDNPPCRNPTHLHLGTKGQNNAEREQRGRGAQPKGAAHYLTKLTEADVLEIRALAARGVSQRQIGARFGMTHANVGYIVRRQSWTHI